MTRLEPVDFPPDCEVVVRALWEYLDRAVAPDDLSEIDAHLEACEYCREHLDFETRLIEELVELRREHSDPARLRARVLAALKDAGFGGE